MGALLSVMCFVALGVLWSTSGTWSHGTHPTIRCAPDHMMLQVRRRKGNHAVERISLQQLLKERCPALRRNFKPVWWLPNGHLQTLYCVIGDFSKNDKMWYKRTYLRVSEGGTLGLDFAPLNHSELHDDTPIVVVQHGLTGGSHAPYVRAILSRACASVEKGGLGYRAIVINFRGCAGVPVTSPLLYSAGHTDDTRQALMYIAQKYPRAPLLGIGFSLGANVLTRYLAEEGDKSRLSAVCTLGCPWDLKQNNDDMLRSFTGKHIYSKGLGGNQLRLLKRHIHSVTKDPNHYIAKAACVALELKNPTLAEFDDAFTRVAGGPRPQFPFPDSNSYYIGCSTHDILDKITVPYLSINAADDPVVRYIPMDGGGNGLVAMVLTSGGGHVGWFTSGKNGIDRWSTEPVLQWLKLFGEEIEYESSMFEWRTFTDSDGFIREEGREDYLGCRALQEVDAFIDGNCSEVRTIPDFESGFYTAQ